RHDSRIRIAGGGAKGRSRRIERVTRQIQREDRGREFTAPRGREHLQGYILAATHPVQVAKTQAHHANARRPQVLYGFEGPCGGISMYHHSSSHRISLSITSWCVSASVAQVRSTARCTAPTSARMSSSAVMGCRTHARRTKRPCSVVPVRKASPSSCTPRMTALFKASSAAPSPNRGGGTARKHTVESSTGAM